MWSSTGRAARALSRGLAFGLALGLAYAVAPATAMGAPAPGAPGTAHGKAGHDKAGHGKAHGKKGAQSVGAPNSGHLAGAMRLRGSKVLRQREGMHSWGLPQLVHLLQHAAGEVARKHRGSQMLIGDLSGRTGGHLDRHGSHQTGRDADVGFFVTNSRGKPMAVKRFIPFDDAGNSKDVQGVRFDEARNWTMIEAMLKDDKASVHYMFITNGLRGKLLAYAAKKHVSKELLDRAATVMMSPNDADLHDDHVHVRISCPESMRDVCIEEAVPREGPRDGARTADADEKPGEPAASGTPAEPPPDAAARAAAPLAEKQADKQAGPPDAAPGAPGGGGSVGGAR